MSMTTTNGAPLSQLPALEPPPGVVPDFDPSYRDLQPAWLTLLSVTLTLTTAIIGARLFVKYHDAKRFQIEDFVAVLTRLLFIVFAALSYVSLRAGLSRYQWDVNALQATRIFYFLNATQIVYFFLLGIGKIGILLEYMRIFCPSHQGFTYKAIHVLIWTNLIVYLTFGIFYVFLCHPREKIWDPTVPGKCINNIPLEYTSGSWSVLTDFCIVALPIQSIWNLHMSVRRKIGISGIFAVGILGCVASISRLVYTFFLVNTQDVAFTVIQLGLWTDVEGTAVILCGSLPKLSKFFQLATRRTKKDSYVRTTAENHLCGETPKRKKNRGLYSLFSIDAMATSSWVAQNGSASVIPLREWSATPGRSNRVTGGEQHRDAASKETVEVGGGLTKNGIWKTVQIESTDTAQPNFV